MTETAVLGGGCFWCTEAAFKQLEGVENVMPGYAGGDTEDPSYREVCTGDTGHAEVVKVEYDPGQVSFRDLLALLFEIHDPTTRDREGPDVGSQYRSIILYSNSEQERVAESFVEEKQDDYEDGIVTEIAPLKRFYPAEEEHRDYFEKHRGNRYCRRHAQPKVEKARGFQDIL